MPAYNCRIELSCSSIIPGREREIEWANDGDSPTEVDIGFGDFVLYPDGEYWKVTHVNIELAKVHLLSCSGSESDIRNKEWCLENKV